MVERIPWGSDGGGVRSKPLVPDPPTLRTGAGGVNPRPGSRGKRVHEDVIPRYPNQDKGHRRGEGSCPTLRVSGSRTGPGEKVQLRFVTTKAPGITDHRTRTVMGIWVFGLKYGTEGLVPTEEGLVTEGPVSLLRAHPAQSTVEEGP